MSIAGVIAVRGARVRVLRSAPTRNADGSSRDTWAEQPETQVHIADGTATQIQQIWGSTTDAEVVGRAMLEDDLQNDDVILPLTGAFFGRRYRVVARKSVIARQPHLLLALEPTTETFVVDGVTI